MLENEKIIDKNVEYTRYISELYPQMFVSSPLLAENMHNYVEGMNSYEKEFVILLQAKGLIVYREPIIEGISCKPDFFVFNPFIYKGKVVEITLFDKEYHYKNNNRKSRERKMRQEESFQQMGIPYVVLYRENLERIREFCCQGLF